jgi:hypothetical protein
MIFLHSTVWSGRTELTSEQEMDPVQAHIGKIALSGHQQMVPRFQQFQHFKPIRKENIAHNSRPLCDLDLTYKTQQSFDFFYQYLR